MYRCAIVTSRNNDFKDFAKGLVQNGDAAVAWEISGGQALNGIADGKTDLIVVDERLDDMTGIAFIRRVVKVNPMINTVVVSRLPAMEFHEATEGLGILMQLPEYPEMHHGEDVMSLLRRICFRLAKTDSTETVEGS